MSNSTRTWLFAIPVTFAVAGMAIFGYLLLSDFNPEQPSSPAEKRQGTGPTSGDRLAGIFAWETGEAVSREGATANVTRPVTSGSDLTLDEFSHFIDRLLTSEQSDHRTLYLSLRDPVGFIDELYRLRHEMAQGMARNTPDPAPRKPHLQVASTGVSESNPEDQFPALPARIRLGIEPGGEAVHGRHVLRWVNSETAEVEYMTLIDIPGRHEAPFTVDTGPLGGRTGAWQLELYQTRDGLPRLTRVPVTVGSDHKASRRSQDPKKRHRYAHSSRKITCLPPRHIHSRTTNGAIRGP